MEVGTVPQVRTMAVLAESIRVVGKAATDVEVALKGTWYGCSVGYRGGEGSV